MRFYNRCTIRRNLLRRIVADMKGISFVLLCVLDASAAWQITSMPVGRRAALGAAAASVFGGKAAHAITDYVKKDFKDGVYVGPSVVGAAPTFEGEEAFEKLYKEDLKKQEAVVKGMGFEMDDSDRFETEMLSRTKYCGFQAKVKCKGSPAAKNGGR